MQCDMVKHWSCQCRQACSEHKVRVVWALWLGTTQATCELLVCKAVLLQHAITA